MTGKYDKLILRAAREIFAESGYYGSRIDAVAERSHLNRKMIFDFCHTKDELYLTVLSDVSREVLTNFTEHISLMNGNISCIYADLFSTLENYGDFLRLWAWERLSPTIHGPRILETVNTIFEKTRELIQNQTNPQVPTSSDKFEAIEALCHGYLLTSAMYFRCEPETDAAEIAFQGDLTQMQSPALHRLEMSMNIQKIVLNSIEQIIQEE